MHNFACSSIDFCGNNKYLVGFTIEGDVRCLDKTEPQILNSYCGEGEVAVGFEEVTAARSNTVSGTAS